MVQKSCFGKPSLEWYSSVGQGHDHAILALLLGCGLRRSEAAHLTTEHFQRRDDYWAIVDLFGKGGHIRSVPVPNWVKHAIDSWTTQRTLRPDAYFVA